MSLTQSAKDKAAFKRELAEIKKTLRSLVKHFDKDTQKKILTPAANFLIKTIKSNIKDSSKPHFRYGTPKLNESIRAPKGKGKVVATYYPGNLRKSITKLRFRRSSGIWVGPKVNKREPSGAFGKGRRVDGWYAHFQEFGTVNNPTPRNFGFMRRSFNSVKSQMIKSVEKMAKKKTKEFAMKNKK